ncbi:DUF4382 domain-containing protein [Chitinophagaceae bacterium LB-8]|uniref:DUF4382 domain-containing protein n=1 Tax=Paraflavisolibacter caeni TaxID=2982496 RepID=A0A9X3B8B5_9BACT|nr:DUF4382 domain-containing protein [Paraflavisolibacter caeni]MCU7549501.1 DUF4382 domain-containing protein [Paraflavisolibacter caeni]
MKITKLLLAVLVVSLSLSFISCSKNESNGKARLQVYLTDDPGDYDEVLIDVQDILVNYTSNENEGWESLNNVKRGTYDVLKLVNDKDTMLADAEMPTGKIEQIRLILGPNNYVKVNGSTIKLETPSAQQSGLKLNIHQDVTGDIIYKLHLDFDVAKSIHQTGNGKFMLKPVIRTILEAAGGTIKGYIKPDSIQTAILAIQGPDTVASTFSLSGGYLIKGLNPGTYDLHFLPSDTTLAKQVKTGISVTIGKVTTVDTLKLK